MIYKYYICIKISVENTSVFRQAVFPHQSSKSAGIMLVSSTLKFQTFMQRPNVRFLENLLRSQF